MELSSSAVFPFQPRAPRAAFAKRLPSPPVPSDPPAPLAPQGHRSCSSCTAGSRFPGQAVFSGAAPLSEFLDGSRGARPDHGSSLPALSVSSWCVCSAGREKSTWPGRESSGSHLEVWGPRACRSWCLALAQSCPPGRSEAEGRCRMAPAAEGPAWSEHGVGGAAARPCWGSAADAAAPCRFPWARLLLRAHSTGALRSARKQRTSALGQGCL